MQRPTSRDFLRLSGQAFVSHCGLDQTARSRPPRDTSRRQPWGNYFHKGQLRYRARPPYRADDDFARGAAIASAAPPTSGNRARILPATVSVFRLARVAIARRERARRWSFERPLVKWGACHSPDIHVSAGRKIFRQ